MAPTPARSAHRDCQRFFFLEMSDICVRISPAYETALVSPIHCLGECRWMVGLIVDFPCAQGESSQAPREG